MALKVYNVLSRTKQDFVPLTPGIVNMYACGSGKMLSTLDKTQHMLQTMY